MLLHLYYECTMKASWMYPKSFGIVKLCVSWNILVVSFMIHTLSLYLNFYDTFTILSWYIHDTIEVTRDLMCTCVRIFSSLLDPLKRRKRRKKSRSRFRINFVVIYFGWEKENLPTRRCTRRPNSTHSWTDFYLGEVALTKEHSKGICPNLTRWAQKGKKGREKLDLLFLADFH